MQNPLWIVLLFLTIITISRVHAYIPLADRTRPAALLFLAAVALAVLRPRLLAARNITRAWPGRTVLALGVMACLSALFGISTGASATFILYSYSKTLLYAGLLIVAIRRWEDIHHLVWAYVAGVGILAFLSIFVVGISKTSSGTTYDANDVGLIMVVGLPLVVVAFQSGTPNAKLLSGLILIGTVVTIARSQSRGAFLGLLVVGLAMLLSLRSVSVVRRLAGVGAAVATLVFAAPKGYWDLVKTLQNPTSDYNWDAVNGRRAIARRGVQYMLQYPLFGIGINNFARAEGTISDKARRHVTGTGIRWAAPHNSFVEVGAELGIPGGLLWLSLVLGGLITVYRLHLRLPSEWRKGDPEQRFLFALTGGLPASLLGFGVTSFFVSFAYLDPLYILAALVSGVILSVPRGLVTTGLVRARTQGRPAQPTVIQRQRPFLGG